MDPIKILDEVRDIIGERGEDYGGVENNFENIARIYSTVAGIEMQSWDIALVMVCVKLARIRQSPLKRDNYLDLIAYAAFAAELIEAE